jgi:hypothetical protein
MESEGITPRIASDVFTPANLAKRANNLAWCSRTVEIRDHYEQGKKRTRCRSCGQHLLCPVCAILRGTRMMRNTLDRITPVLQADPTLRLYLLTMTVRDGPDLVERFGLLDSMWQALRDRRRKPRYRGDPLQQIEGAIASVEVVRGKGSGLWHPHLHAIIAVRGSLPVHQDDRGAYRFPHLSELMRSVTGGDSFICECHPITTDTGEVPDDLDTLDPASLMGAVCEISKYAVKLSNLDPRDQFQAFASLRTLRLVRSLGCFYGRSTDDDAQPAEEDLGPFIAYLYGWTGRDYKLRSVQLPQPSPTECPPARASEAHAASVGVRPASDSARPPNIHAGRARTPFIRQETEEYPWHFQTPPSPSSTPATSTQSPRTPSIG